MAEGEVRIKDLDTITNLNNNHYFVIDSAGVVDKTYRFSAEEYLTMGQHMMGALNNEIDTTTAMWSESGSYVKSDVVINPTDARIYACNVANATVGTFVSSEWSALTLMGISGALFLNMSAEPMTFNQPISKGDVVYRVADASPYNPLYRGFYRAKADHPDGVASYVASDWEYFESITALISDSNNRVMTLEDEMVTKAEQDGIYDLVSGNVKSNSYEVDTAPYLYRPSKDGSAVEEEIVGATVAWNQLVQNGNFASTDGWAYNNCSISVSSNELTATASSNTTPSLIRNNVPKIQNHKYIFSVNVYPQEAMSAVALMIGGSTIFRKESLTGSTWNNVLGIINISNTTTDGMSLYFNYNNANNGKVTKFRNYMFIDLTQAFGSTIADYIYTLEQATSGSGIAWLKSYGFLTKDYYAYDSGSLQSVNVASRKIVGKNQCPQFDSGSLNGITFKTLSDGSVIVNGTATSTANYVVTLPPTMKGTYYLNGCPSGGGSSSYQLWVYNITDGASLNKSDTGNGVGGINLEFGKTYQIRIRIASGYTVNNLRFYPMLCYENSSNYLYEPYTTKSYTLNTGELRGLFKLDGDKLVADGDVRKSDSQNTRFGIVNLGSLDYTYYSTSDGNLFRSTISDMVTTTGTTLNVLCPKYIAVPQSDRTNGTITSSANTKNIDIIDNNYTDATTFKNAMNGIYLLYPLATPTTESATPFENPQLVFSGGTEEFIDGATRDVAIPVGQNSKYAWDIKGKVEQLYGIPEPPSTNGTYKLVCTVSSGVKTYSWVSN